MNRPLLLAIAFFLIAGLQFAVPAEARRPKPPSLLIKTKPSGADFTLTGGPKGESHTGRTPFKSKDVAPGTYTLTVNREGYEGVEETVEVAATGKTKLSYRLQKSSSGLSRAEKDRRREALQSRLDDIRRQLVAMFFIGNYAENLPEVNGDLYSEPNISGLYYRVFITPQQGGSELHTFNLFLDEAERLPAGSGRFVARPGAFPLLEGSLTITDGRPKGLSGNVTTSSPGPDQYRVEFTGTMGQDATFTAVALGDPFPLDWAGGSLAWGPSGDDEQATLTSEGGEDGVRVAGMTPDGAETYSFVFQGEEEQVTVVGQLRMKATGALLAELTADLNGNGTIVYSDGTSEQLRPQ